MLDIQVQKKVRFAKIEQAHAWLIVAVLVEIRNGQAVAVSEPKVVKIIQKNQAGLLLGTSKSLKQASTLALASVSKIYTKKNRTLSPYFSLLFGSTNFNNITGLAAQPPTFLY